MKKLKLMKLSKAGLEKRAMDDLRGGCPTTDYAKCGCACKADQNDFDVINTNMTANHAKGLHSFSKVYCPYTVDIIVTPPIEVYP